MLMLLEGEDKCSNCPTQVRQLNLSCLNLSWVLPCAGIYLDSWRSVDGAEANRIGYAGRSGEGWQSAGVGWRRGQAGSQGGWLVRLTQAKLKRVYCTT